jgi:ATP-binding cassette subfamily C (CFTR/MRP) protein 1
MTAQAFTSVALVSLLTTPVLVFIQALPQVAQCLGCFDRIQEYCNYAQPIVQYEANSDHGGEASIVPRSIQLENALDRSFDTVFTTNSQNFYWQKGSPAALHDLHVSIYRGRFTAVTGPIGSGKSTFLASMLNETIARPERTTQTIPNIAYCAQDAWLEYGTVRDNILGVSEFDEEWYAEVINACGLVTDLGQMDKGDATLVGSKGLNLSGGQKQRIVCS